MQGMWAVVLMGNLPPTKFRTILIDAPWPERGGGKIKRGADRHYPLMSVPKIMALPVAWHVRRGDTFRLCRGLCCRSHSPPAPLWG